MVQQVVVATNWPACEKIYLIDDGNAAVHFGSSLLGVLPGTGGLTRLVDDGWSVGTSRIFSAQKLKDLERVHP